jgi:hypothetical protein
MNFQLGKFKVLPQVARQRSLYLRVLCIVERYLIGGGNGPLVARTFWQR